MDAAGDWWSIRSPRDATAVAARLGGLIVVAVGLTVALTS
jgi:hypothetical protein